MHVKIYFLRMSLAKMLVVFQRPCNNSLVNSKQRRYMTRFNSLKKFVLNLSVPFTFSYFTGIISLPIQFEGSIPLQKILNFLKRMFFLTPSFPASGVPRKTREALILDFWRAVEYFAVKQTPEVSPPPKNKMPPSVEQVFPYNPTDPLPWEPNHWIAQSPKKDEHFLRFKVFGGVYPDRMIYQILEEKCGKDDNYEGDLGASEKPKEGDACAYFFAVTDDGRPLFDSFLLPTCGWALGRTIAPGPHHPDWFTDFDEFAMQAKQDFQEHFAIEDNDPAGQELKQFNVGRIITNDHLITYTKKIIASLGLEGALETPGIRLQSVYIKNKKLPENGRYDVQDIEFLNSFSS
jgi:hypothetical protein